MPLKTQVILVASLFVVFACLNVLARMRNSSMRKRKRRRRVPGASRPDLQSQLLAAEIDAEAPPQRLPRPTLVLIILAVLMALGAIGLVLFNPLS